jgi:hypothetical protein
MIYEYVIGCYHDPQFLSVYITIDSYYCHRRTFLNLFRRTIWENLQTLEWTSADSKEVTGTGNCLFRSLALIVEDEKEHCSERKRHRV